LRENIAQDQEKSDSLKTQIQDLNRNIQKMDTKIQQAESTLRDLRKLQDEISTKTTTRSTYYKLQQEQYGALEEENEDTDEELQEWQAKFGEKIAQLENKIQKLGREMEDTVIRLGNLNNANIAYTLEIGKLQHEADEQIKLKHTRDTSIESLFKKHNLGSLPSIPFSDEVAFSLTNRVKTRVADLEKDIQDKKMSNDLELQGLWESYVAANMRYSSLEAQKQAKLTAKEGVIKRMKEKEEERQAAEDQLVKYNLSRIDEREQKL
ncbi:hypothetical protein MKW94_017965, partial [Papaver nudicaule]|nr:hypothetical protein [Papaver nudicaule]